MNCLKKKAMFITAGFLGIGGYILYQNLKSRIDDLEEEIWGIEDFEIEDCPYCDKAYTMEYETCNDFTKNTDQIILENVKMENSKNELHDEVQEYLQHAEEEKNEYDKDENK